MTASLRRVGTGPCDQSLLDVAFDLHILGSFGLESPSDGGIQPAGHEQPTDATDGPEATAQCFDDGFIALVRDSQIGQQKDAGMNQSSSSSFASGNQFLQADPFFSGECDSVLLQSDLRVE